MVLDRSCVADVGVSRCVSIHSHDHSRFLKFIDFISHNRSPEWFQLSDLGTIAGIGGATADTVVCYVLPSVFLWKTAPAGDVHRSTLTIEIIRLF